MRGAQDSGNVYQLRPLGSAREKHDGALGDLRFRGLLGPEKWAALPPAVRARFSKRLGGAKSVVYVGEVVECRMSPIGRAFAQALRPFGAPLPLGTDTLVPAVVSVTEDPASGGQFWVRQYGRKRGFPQVIHSSKRFAGPTGLEEYLGLGLGVALRLEVEGEALLFVSDHYFLRLGALRVRLPRLLTPGRLTVGHVDCDHGWFAFTLDLTHRLLGTLVHQTALFAEAKTGD